MKFKFFSNVRCEYFPCHEVADKRRFNCLMCFCPLYYIPDCGGDFTVLKSGIKDCSKCILPHYDYEYVVRRIKQYNGETAGKQAKACPPVPVQPPPLP